MGGEPLGESPDKALMDLVSPRPRSGSSVLPFDEFMGAARSSMSRAESTPEGESTKPL
jgi:hypothetical protein